MNKVISNLKFSVVFAREIILLSILFEVLIILLFEISSPRFLGITFTIIIFDFIILFFIGRKRKKEIEEIKSVIRSIRKNILHSEEEIKLSKSLIDLEGNIKAMFRRTQKDLAAMQKLAQARSDFLGYVSHELRTPIFTIQGYLETLLNGAIDNPNVNRKFLEKTLTHSNNLNSLLNDLIDISMIESGLMSLSFRFFNLNNFLQNIVNEIKSLTQLKNIELLLSDFDKEIEIYGDKEKLTQVLNNLLSNAIKYTEKGKIEILVLEKNKTVTISVKDTGIGIPENEIDRIFERFYRTERDRSSTIPGTGLGLSIVKHILEAHNSAIEVKSILNVGSEFSFKLKRD
ncbi:MAG: GHKL domain-containing protein [Ignavibacteriae bacterium]|nr:GHKL domain-containing protein [Ignavibacteriota bacterium]